MSRIKDIPSFLLMLLMAPFVYSFMYQPAPPLLKFIIQRGSSLSIDGRTNINKFACEISDYSHADTLTITKNQNDNTVEMMGGLTVNIEGFNCHNAAINADLRKTLNTAAFPTMLIRFISMNKFPALSPIGDQVIGIAEIELAGVRKRVELTYTFKTDENKKVVLQGIKSVKFSDFNLIPPKKLGGMIQAKDNLDVLFYLDLKLIP